MVVCGEVWLELGCGVGVGGVLCVEWGLGVGIGLESGVVGGVLGGNMGQLYPYTGVNTAFRIS